MFHMQMIKFGQQLRANLTEIRVEQTSPKFKYNNCTFLQIKL